MGDRQVFIGNLCNISTEKLRSYCETYGPLTELSLNRDKENNIYHCFAFVTFQHSRCTCQFVANRPHFLNGEEIFVKRALSRFTASIPERLIVTNRLVVEDAHKHDKHALRSYFQKFGQMKKFDFDRGFIDYNDYDDVDRVLLARPHYIRDEEISVTKFIPSEHQDHSQRPHHYRSHINNHRQINEDEDASGGGGHKQLVERNLHVTSDSIKICRTRAIQRHSPQIKVNEEEEEEEDDSRSSEELVDRHQRNSRYEDLHAKFEEYKQSKELEICTLRLDLERTKRQLADVTQEKLDLLIKNQQSFHQDLVVRLFPEQISAPCPTTDDYLRSTPNKLAKKRKLATSSTPCPSGDREYDYYS